MLRITAPPPSLAWTTADLLNRVVALVALSHAHIDLHPDAYTNPSGRLLIDLVDEEMRRLLSRSDE